MTTYGFPARQIDAVTVRDIAPDVLDHTGRLRILPAAYWATTTPQERSLLGHRHGLYSFPTTELVDHLQQMIAGRPAIEIGAGHGVLAEALGIPATDSRQQEKPKYREIYDNIGQAIVPYGPNIIEMEASRAVRRHKAEVVIGCWVTHKFEPRRPHAGGNEAGIDEANILANCAEYIVVGNTEVHQYKPIWDRPHTIEHPDFVYSRAFNDSPDFIAAWTGRKGRR